MKLFPAALSLLLVLASCGDSTGSNPPAQQNAASDDHDHDHDHDDEDHSHDDSSHEHVHVAPHGGTLIPIGDHFANFEVEFDANTGNFTLWVLDGHAENPVRLNQLTIPVEFHPNPQTSVASQLEARGNKLTGESKGDTSEFGVMIPDLIGFESFDVTVRSVQIQGHRPPDRRFTYPSGENQPLGGSTPPK